MRSDGEDARTISEVMARVVQTVGIDTTVRDADLAELFRNTRYVPVVTLHRRVVGLASREDLCAAVRDGDGEATPREVMLLGVPLLPADAPTSHAVQQLRASRVDALPVVDDDRRLIGIVTAGQLELRDETGEVAVGHEDEFDRCLDALETEAGTGLVPGELKRWCTHVGDRMARLSECWELRRRDRYAMMDRIRELDAALHARADELGRHEQELAHRFGLLCVEVGRIAAAAQSERHDELGDLRSRIAHWTADVRAHDGDLQTWHNEAMLRDRGVGD